MSIVVGGIVGVAVLFVLGALLHFGERIGDRIAYGPRRRPVDPAAAAQYDRKRGDYSGLGGM